MLAGYTHTLQHTRPSVAKGVVYITSGELLYHWHLTLTHSQNLRTKLLKTTYVHAHTHVQITCTVLQVRG